MDYRVEVVICKDHAVLTLNPADRVVSAEIQREWVQFVILRAVTDGPR